MTKRLVVHESGNHLEVPVFTGATSGHTYVQIANSSNVGTVKLGGASNGNVSIFDSSANLRMSLSADVAGNAQINGYDASGTNTFTINSAGIFSGPASCQYLTSTVATGTPPLFVTSTTVVTNLNADKLDGYDATAFEAAGTTSTHAALTAAHGATGAVVGTTNSQTLTNKTIVVANNTITTAASGNLAATELNAALAELQADIDTRATTQKGRIRFLKSLPPATLFATEDIRPGGSSPAESVIVWDFDAASIEYMDFLCVLEHYGGGGLTFSLPWSATSATSGAVRWGVAIRRMTDDAEDVDASKTYDFNEVDDTAASASGELSYATITFTNGTDMDNLADGELAIVRVRRNGSHANDTMSGDAELWLPNARET
ncbi:hypothetical protein [Anatilimnocola floriformis]|uniref:hypothetical protein n=1 Tax=Anatilimnocola floriformis TaxID=2948575 RepID=UPI0020C435A9|nr:hypothetical protein [Anatilimnocola floriformis]